MDHDLRPRPNRVVHLTAAAGDLDRSEAEGDRTTIFFEV